MGTDSESGKIAGTVIPPVSALDNQLEQIHHGGLGELQHSNGKHQYMNARRHASNTRGAGKGKADLREGEGTLGTFAGVFTPSILTILGIILFLRLGYVVGNAGLGKALMILGLANAISILTSISLAAVATNLRVKGGGDYYLISRTLGVEFGGSIGLVLFMAQSVSIAF